MQHQKPSVHFRSIEILEFAYTIGDNPSVSSGVPLSMEWAPQMKTVIPLCVFETHRPPRSRECGPRRICSRRREKILLRNGCPIEDMITAASDVLEIQNERAFTQYQLQARKLAHSRRQSDIHQEPAEATEGASSLPSIGILSPDRSRMLSQRRLSQLTYYSTIKCPSSPTAVSPTDADKEKLSQQHRLSPPGVLVHPRPSITRMIARSA